MAYVSSVTPLFKSLPPLVFLVRMGRVDRTKLDRTDEPLIVRFLVIPKDADGIFCVFSFKLLFDGFSFQYEFRACR